MSIRIKGALWFFTAAFLIGTAMFYFTFSFRKAFELSEIATDIGWAAAIAIIAGGWGFKYAPNIAKSAKDIEAFGFGCLIAALSLLTLDILLWLILMVGGIIGWFTHEYPHSSIYSFASFLGGLFIMLPATIFVSFFISSVGIIFAGIPGWLFWRRYRNLFSR